MNTQIKNFLTIAVLTGTVFITACAAKDKTTNNINGLTASGDPISGMPMIIIFMKVTNWMAYISIR